MRLAGELQQWLDRPSVERLKDGVRVVVAGPPNAGKSSLINAISGSERAIVTDIPGTTRDHIDVPMALSGIPILLTDTAGLRETEDAVESIGVARASALVEAADVLLWLGDADDAPEHPRLIKVHAQADRPERAEAPQGTLPTSAVSGFGVASLLERVGELARQLLPDEGAVALNRRQAELLDEAARALRDAAGAIDLVIAAEQLRQVRGAFDRLSGRAGVEDLLDALFGRFCLGK
jgi:tRNA modification GTPase